MLKTPLRHPDTYERYKREKRSGISVLPSIREWVHWKLVTNEFPYDAVFDKHDLLVLKRGKANLFSLTEEERDELEAIINEVEHDYDCMLYPFQHTMTYPTTLHLHLLHTIVLEDEDND